MKRKERHYNGGNLTIHLGALIHTKYKNFFLSPRYDRGAYKFGDKMTVYRTYFSGEENDISAIIEAEPDIFASIKKEKFNDNVRKLYDNKKYDFLEFPQILIKNLENSNNRHYLKIKLKYLPCGREHVSGNLFSAVGDIIDIVRQITRQLSIENSDDFSTFLS